MNFTAPHCWTVSHHEPNVTPFVPKVQTQIIPKYGFAQDLGGVLEMVAGDPSQWAADFEGLRVPTHDL